MLACPSPWRPVLTLDSAQRVADGCPADLRAAIRRAADVRVYSEFRHNEHIDTDSSVNELVREAMDMRVTYLVDDRWAAAALSLRQPVELPHGFGPRPSLSLFLYNENGDQAIARPHLDGPPSLGPVGPSPAVDHSAMPRYRELDRFDDDTNAPSSNFVYAFDVIRWLTRDDWTEALSHDAAGTRGAAQLRPVCAAPCPGRGATRDPLVLPLTRAHRQHWLQGGGA